MAVNGILANTRLQLEAPDRLRGLSERATYMTEIAPEALADLDVGPKPGFSRFIRREPLGVVLVLAPGGVASVVSTWGKPLTQT